MTESVIRVEAVRTPGHRKDRGNCLPLAKSIDADGLRRPIVVWRDGVLISGERRLFAHLLLKKERIQAVYVNTIEEAAKHLLGDNQDAFLSLTPKWSEVCHLWQTLRRLDEPAAIRRATEARRRGVELRRQTQRGERRPGRSNKRTDDYVLSVICEPFDISGATATRVETIWKAANGLIDTTDEKRELARELMANIDSGTESVWSGFAKYRGERPQPVARPRPIAVPPSAPVPGVKQVAAWERTLPQLEGLLVGLIEQGPPNPELTWDQVGPVHSRLRVIRRELDKIINGMKETSK